MSDTEIRMMRYTIEQLSEELQAKRQYVSDIETKLDRTRKALDAAIRGLDQMTWGCGSTDAEYLLKEIKEITALEQKDVK